MINLTMKNKSNIVILIKRSYYVISGKIRGGLRLKKRKLIGVLISEVEELYQQKLLRGIITQCYGLNYDVAIFSTFIKDTGLPEYKRGEKNIYNLVNYDRFDGIIVAPLTLAIENLSEEIEETLKKKCKCPVIYVDKTSEYFPHIETDDRNAMEQIVDHLIDKHGYKDIFCLAGDLKSVATLQRVDGYKASLIKHNIPVDESRISYEGDFYFTGGEKLARKIVSGEIKKPEAVVCLNDYMAIGLSDELLNYGFHIPEDMAITGYDAVDEVATSYTTITTFEPPVVQTGINVVCELSYLITGVKPQPIKEVFGSLEVGNSCGCKEPSSMSRSSVLRLKDKLEDYRRFFNSYMQEAITSPRNLEDVLNKFGYYLYLINDYSDYYLCLCDEWDETYDTTQCPHPMDGYTKEMKMVLARVNTEYVPSNYMFKTEDMIPDLWKDRDKPKAYYFTPLHYNGYCIGYSVLTYGNKIQSYDITYRNWSRYVMNALEYIRVNKQLYLSSFRDALTGAYNRNGFKQKLPGIIEEGIDMHKKVFVIMADLDNLKAVNDRYGHMAGDDVIVETVNAIRSCLTGNEICVRIGGDEFLIVGTYEDESDNYPETLINNIKAYINKYNKRTRKPYSIRISMGEYTGYIKKESDIEDMINLADEAMYKDKARNKKTRNF